MKNNHIYFLEDRVRLSDKTDCLVLFDSTLYYDNPKTDLQELFSLYECATDTVSDDNLYTGFIYKEGRYINSANATRIAKHFIFHNTVIRNGLNRINYRNTDLSFLEKTESIRVIEDDKKKIGPATNNLLLKSVFSYHINVGHGNCSIILHKTKIYMVDCSEYDYLEHKNYLSNILDCIKHIKTAHKIGNFVIDTFVLTHPHFDHYSGMISLIKKKYITSETSVYINSYYSMQNPKYTEMMQELMRIKCKIINPIFNLSDGFMDILYPPVTVIKNSFNNHPHDEKPIIESNPNNASVVTLFSDADCSFLFPGDLETSGWDRMNPCGMCSKKIKYFALSHHGSITGFYRNKCQKHKSIQSVAECLTNPSVFFLGRNGAYNGIPSKNVLSAFNPVYSSEIDNNGTVIKFLELDWSSNSVKYFHK